MWKWKTNTHKHLILKGKTRTVESTFITCIQIKYSWLKKHVAHWFLNSAFFFLHSSTASLQVLCNSVWVHLKSISSGHGYFVFHKLYVTFPVMQYQTAAVMQCQTSLILIMNKVFNQKSALFGQLPSSVVSTTSKTNFPTYLFNRIRIALRTVQCIHNTLLYSSLVR